MAKTLNARTATVKILLRLLKQQGSLASELSLANELDEQERRFTQELCYGVCRWYFFLHDTLGRFIEKPLKAKDNDIKLLLLLGIYQLQFTRVASHAALNETVDGALYFRKPWAKKLINGVLRAFLREQEKQTISPNAKQSHPQWLQDAILKAWPQQAREIFVANNQHPPFTLRVNSQQANPTQYLDQLNEVELSQAQPTAFSSQGLTLDKAVDVTQLPGFSEGRVSVQDEAAQLAAPLLDLAPGQRVLDACCAPGGKTCHIGEWQNDLSELVAVELEERRLGRVRENLARLGIQATITCADASKTQDWWDGQLFDRILLDAPCSATGVIRRHPDVKLLRSQKAVDELSELQLRLLNALWPLLAEGGILVYATCSVLPQENTQLIDRFLQTHSDAYHDKITAQWGIEQPYGRQLFPQDNGHDGFYYARLKKITTTQ